MSFEKAVDAPIDPPPVLTRIQSQLGPIATHQSVLEHGHPVAEDGAEVKLSQARKWALLVIFSLALFVDGESTRRQSRRTDTNPTCVESVFMLTLHSTQWWEAQRSLCSPVWWLLISTSYSSSRAGSL